ncbi:MAG: hypothetical protein RLZZ253_3034, partial [Verrucomicrobiota bacterium]
LSQIRSQSDLEALISATSEAALKKALAEHATAILAAAQQHPHVLAVIQTIESAPGSLIKVNTTPEPLKKAVGGELPLFDTLTQVNTGILNGKAHVYRKADEDPYDAAFLEHLGDIPSLESVKIVATKIQDSWLPPLLKLKNLESLSMEGRAVELPGKPALGDPSLERLTALTGLRKLTSLELAYFGDATDAGLERLAGLKNLERFTFRGSPVKGHGFSKFKGWTKLKSINFHSNSLDDEGFGHVCQNFPNLEFIKLWHSKLLTDASAENLGKLTKLTGIEISASKATAGLLKHLRQVPLEYAALEYGVNAPAADAIATMKSIPTLRRLKLGGPLTDPDLTELAGATQLRELSLELSELTAERLPQLQAFSFLKSLTLTVRPKSLSNEVQNHLKALLPNVEVKFAP